MAGYPWQDGKVLERIQRRERKKKEDFENIGETRQRMNYTIVANRFKLLIKIRLGRQTLRKTTQRKRVW